MAQKIDAQKIDGECHGGCFAHVDLPRFRLIVVGTGAVAQVLAPMAELAGFKVTVSEGPCPPPDAETALVTLCHDPQRDDPVLVTGLRSPAFYIGALGSTRTHARRLDRLRELGVPEVDLARIHGPVGLSLGGRSPAEIAVSILAEIIQVRAQGGAA